MLSLLIKIYEPIIIIANCNLTVLISRWYFCEPNKLGFTIFGHLHHLLSFIKVGFITKITKHFYSQEIKKPKHASQPKARLGSGGAAPAQRGATVARPSGAAQAQQRRRQRGPAASGSGRVRAQARQRQRLSSVAAGQARRKRSKRRQAGSGRQRGQQVASAAQREQQPTVAYFNVLRLYFPT